MLCCGTELKTSYLAGDSDRRLPALDEYTCAVHQDMLGSEIRRTWFDQPDEMSGSMAASKAKTNWLRARCSPGGSRTILFEERTTTVSDFWGSLLRLEGFWNSPLRVEILRVVATGAFFILGVVAGRVWAMWRRYRQKKIAEGGVSEDVVTIEKVLLDRRDDGTQVMRIRSCGRDPIETVFPNQAARDEFQSRTGATTAARPLVSMDGKMGSYLLQELAIWVCGQLRERGFRHDVWVMAPVYERGRFTSAATSSRRCSSSGATTCCSSATGIDVAAIEVEHASHGERILDSDEHGRRIRAPRGRDRRAPRGRPARQL